MNCEPLHVRRDSKSLPAKHADESGSHQDTLQLLVILSTLTPLRPREFDTRGRLGKGRK
jgi:hypothetical protein